MRDEPLIAATCAAQGQHWTQWWTRQGRIRDDKVTRTRLGRGSAIGMDGSMARYKGPSVGAQMMR